MSMNTLSAFLPHAAERAVLIETNSAAAHMDITPGYSSYTVAKFAIARFYQCVAFEHPSLRIHSVHPGAIDTEMSRGAGYKAKSESEAEGEESQWKGEGAEMLSEQDHVCLPASFYVWLASGEGEFLRGKFLWANWDVEELKRLRERIEGSRWLNVGLQGWPFA
ncbi:putative oxidoreductase [Ampelomyces quisqualis]|uniref:Putative oxidoreductase n=1 Tax=Ampelomyces quisqualis TaxID=50730 RepID=A0A6A5QGE6_AMPQU|nr:putative oxidoreductase [Ampelomyces quisqualis]